MRILIPAAAALTMVMAVSTVSVVPAQAAPNLQCNSPFNKKVLTATSVRCQKKKSNFSSRQAAGDAANNWLTKASCNAHKNTPTKQIWRKSNGKWVAKVKFICAAIT